VQEARVAGSKGGVEDALPGHLEILGRHRNAVAPARVRPDLEEIPPPGLMNLPGTCDVRHDVHFRGPLDQAGEQLVANGVVESGFRVERIEGGGMAPLDPERPGRRTEGSLGTRRTHALPDGEAFLVGAAGTREVEYGVVERPELHQGARFPFAL